MSRELDMELLNAEADRIERIRDYVPAEEFDRAAAQEIAHQELAPYYGHASE